jgi:chaperone required for assembly of F1-ATPase
MTERRSMRDILAEIDGEEANPMRKAQQAMRPPLPKRFYEQVTVAPHDDGFAVLLDGRPVRTPARNLLALPTSAAAKVIATEFEAQETEIDPSRMPATRLANTVVDGIAPDPQPVLEDVVRFAASDLVCYRAGSPRELAARQAAHWDPLIDWLRDSFGANFILAEGVMHVAQPREALAVFQSVLQRHGEPFAIGAIHTFASLTGSAILALAIAEGRLPPEDAWRLAMIDEDWNIAHWGEDAEAASRRSHRLTEFEAAAKLLASLKIK